MFFVYFLLKKVIMFIIYYQQFSAISLPKRVVMLLVFYMYRVLCLLSCKESSYLYICCCEASVSERSIMNVVNYIQYIPDERGTLVTNELQCPSVSDDHKSIYRILYIGRARGASATGASIVLYIIFDEGSLATGVYIQSYRSQIGNKWRSEFSIS